MRFGSKVKCQGSLTDALSAYSVSQKNPSLRFSDIFFPNGWEFLVQISRTYYSFLSTLDYKFLSSYLKF